MSTLPSLPPVNADSPAMSRWINAVAAQLNTLSGDRVTVTRDLKILAAKVASTPASKTVEQFADEIKSTQLYKDLSRRLDDPSRFDSMVEEVRAILLTDLAAEAKKRGADVSSLEHKFQSATDSLAYRVDEVTAAVESAYAGVREMSFATANANQAQAGKVTQLAARLDVEVDPLLVMTPVYATLAALKTAVLTPDAAKFYQVTNPIVGQDVILYQWTAGNGWEVAGKGLSAGLEQSMRATADRNAGSEAQYTLKVSAGGKIAGFGLSATSPLDGGASSAFIINADKFALVSGSTTVTDPLNPDLSLVPFGVDASGVYINGGLRINTGGATLDSITEPTGVNISYTSAFFKVDSTGAAVNTSITLSASLSGAIASATDNITWTHTGTSTTPPAPAAAPNAYVVAAADQTGDTETYTATIVVSGTTYSKSVTLVRLRDGEVGQRGSLTVYVSGSAWSNAAAQTAICTASGEADLSANLVIGDTVTISNGSSFASTKYWSGSAWAAPGVVIDGNLLVSGTVSAGAIAATAIDGKTITGATVKYGKTSFGSTTNGFWLDGSGNFSVGGASYGISFAAGTGVITLNGAVVGSGNIASGAVTSAKFASGIEPVSIVASVPGVLSTRSVFNTTDGKLYRWNGSAYVASVPAADVTGTLSDAQLAGISAAKLVGTLTDAQLAAISAAKITGTITGTQITNGAISTAKLAAGSVTAATIAADTITAGNIAAGAITSSELAAGAVIAGKITAGAIVAGDIATGTITATQIAANTITASQIAADTITAGQIAAGAISATELSATAIDGKTITGATVKYGKTSFASTVNGFWLDGSGNFSVGGSTYGLSFNGTTGAMTLNGAVVGAANFASGIEPITKVTSVPGVLSTQLVFNTTDDKLYRWTGTAYVSTTAAADITGTLADSQIAAVAAAKVTGTLTDTQIAAIAAAKVTGQITGTQITDSAITTAKISAGAVTSASIAADTITAANIAASAITATELAAGAVVAGKIAAGTIVAADISAGAITAGKIAALSITAGEIAANTITAGKIAAGTITATQIATGTITATELSATAIDSKTITLSTAGSIKGGQTAYDTGTGFFLGYSTGYKFSIGNSAGNKMTWDGSTLAVTGAISATSTINGVTASTVTAGAAAGATAIQPAGITAKLEAGTSYTLTGVVTPANTGALKVGTITWNSTTGALTGGTGIAITENGIIGALAGVSKFAILADGTATFKGDITGANGAFSGTVSASNITAGTLTGSTINTAASGTRVEISSSGNSLKFYNGVNNLVTIGGTSATVGIDVATSGLASGTGIQSTTSGTSIVPATTFVTTSSNTNAAACKLTASGGAPALSVAHTGASFTSGVDVTSATGANYGAIKGSCTGTGYGVYGTTSNASGRGVYGASTAAAGYGGYFENASGTALYAAGAIIGTTTLKLTEGFGCNTKTPQGAFAVRTDATDLATALTLVNQLRAILVANGICTTGG